MIRFSRASICLLHACPCKRVPLRSFRSQLRGLASEVDEGAYEEKLQLQQLQKDTFYDSQAEHRRYFYFVDSKGRLFLEDTTPKNIATSLKSDKFLDFFFRQWISPCGKKEMNYIRAADTPIVFHSMRERSTCSDTPPGDTARSQGPSDRRGDSNMPDTPRGSSHELLFGASLAQPFDPSRLRMSREGRLYHEIDRGAHRRMGMPMPDDGDASQTETSSTPSVGSAGDWASVAAQSGRLGLGLVASSVAVELSDRIEIGSGDGEDGIDFLEVPAAATRSENSEGGLSQDGGEASVGLWAPDAPPAGLPVLDPSCTSGQRPGWPLGPGLPRVVGTFRWQGLDYPIREAPCRPVLLWR